MDKLSNDQEKISNKNSDNRCSNIPLRYAGLCFDYFHLDNENQKSIKKYAEFFVESFSVVSQLGGSIIFSGGTGTGKTMLAMIMMQALQDKGYTTCYQSAFECLRFLQKNHFLMRNRFQDALDYYRNFPLLIIDNFTIGNGLEDELTEREHQLLFSLLDDRYQQCLSTLLITNHSIEELTNMLGNGVMDRLNEAGIMMTFNWESYRSKPLSTKMELKHD